MVLRCFLAGFSLTGTPQPAARFCILRTLGHPVGGHGVQVAEEAEIEAATALNVTFTEEGPLGFRFKPNPETDDMEVTGTNGGSQAKSHPELKPGLLVQAVGGESVVGLGYKQTLAAIKAGGRPLTVGFINKPEVQEPPPTEYMGTRWYRPMDNIQSSTKYMKL